MKTDKRFVLRMQPSLKKALEVVAKKKRISLNTLIHSILENHNMKTEKFICNGNYFNSIEGVDSYCAEKNFRITNTETITTKKGKRYLISVTSN